MANLPSLYGDAAESAQNSAQTSALNSVLNDGYIQPTFADGLRIWWAIFWKVQLIASVVEFATAAYVMLLYRQSKLEAGPVRIIMMVSPFVMTYAATFLIMYFVLRKKFRRFRLSLTSGAVPGGTTLAPYTAGRVARVWFAYSWRTLIYGLIATFVASVPMGVVLGVFTRMPVVHGVLAFLIQIAINGAVGLFVIYSNIVDEQFGDFRVTLMPRESATPVIPSAPAPIPANL